MDKLFHVFISSTYSDLIDERKKVSDAVSKAGYVAEGMEIFPASSQKQMDFIERVIDRCDYYFLIIAGRYGSEAEDGQSYTEKEFQYAKSRKIPVLAFIRNDLDKLEVEDIEQDPEKQKKLEKFINSFKDDTLVDFWSQPDELAVKALAALSQERATHEGIGWIRGDSAASTAILTEINELRKENSELKNELAQSKPSPIFEEINLARLDENFEIRYRIRGNDNYSSASLSWLTILAATGANFRKPSNTSSLEEGLKRAIRRADDLGNHLSISIIDTEDKERILMQFEALGIMKANTYNLKNGGQAIFHQLTDNGLAIMLRENVVKSTKEN
ncbi:hypothetical protein NBRC116602_06930 [Hyphomicrobiales bacterium 4NK60-0047b]